MVGSSQRLTSDHHDDDLPAGAPAPCPLDLSRLTFVDPAGLVSVAVRAEHCRLAGHGVRFTGPEDDDVATYLSRMRLGEHLDRLGVTHRLPPVQARDRRARLVELHRFDDAAGLDALLDGLLHTFVDDRPRLLQPLYVALAEVAGNVVEHSGRTHGHLALQRYDRRGAVEFAVGDSGIGLRARLSQSLDVPDDRDALVQAARTHVTTTGERGRGRGISEVIALTGPHGGEVTLTSGRARGSFLRGDLRPQIVDLDQAHPGTLASVRLVL